MGEIKARYCGCLIAFLVLMGCDNRIDEKENRAKSEPSQKREHTFDEREMHEAIEHAGDSADPTDPYEEPYWTDYDYALFMLPGCDFSFESLQSWLVGRYLGCDTLEVELKTKPDYMRLKINDAWKCKMKLVDAETLEREIDYLKGRFADTLHWLPDLEACEGALYINVSKEEYDPGFANMHERMVILQRLHGFNNTRLFEPINLELIDREYIAKLINL